MRLTLWTDYALRTLIYVGAKGGRLSTIAEIAESFDVSKTHLMKVVNRLGQQGYIETVRGKGGGIRLGRPPAEIRVGAVVRETEEDLAVMGCLAETGFCRIAWASHPRCGLGDEPSASADEPRRGQSWMMSLSLGRLHVLAVVIWIGGVAMVTTAVLPAVRRGDLGPNRLRSSRPSSGGMCGMRVSPQSLSR